jgi:hypothetical protein
MQAWYNVTNKLCFTVTIGAIDTTWQQQQIEAERQRKLNEEHQRREQEARLRREQEEIQRLAREELQRRLEEAKQQQAEEEKRMQEKQAQALQERLRLVAAKAEQKRQEQEKLQREKEERAAERKLAREAQALELELQREAARKAKEEEKARKRAEKDRARQQKLLQKLVHFKEDNEPLLAASGGVEAMDFERQQGVAKRSRADLEENLAELLVQQQPATFQPIQQPAASPAIQQPAAVEPLVLKQMAIALTAPSGLNPTPSNDPTAGIETQRTAPIQLQPTAMSFSKPPPLPALQPQQQEPSKRMTRSQSRRLSPVPPTRQTFPPEPSPQLKPVSSLLRAVEHERQKAEIAPATAKAISEFKARRASEFNLPMEGQNTWMEELTTAPTKDSKDDRSTFTMGSATGWTIQSTGSIDFAKSIDADDVERIEQLSSIDTDDL